jgi:hypothetical protein
MLAPLLLVGGAGARATSPPILLGADSTEYTGGTPPNCYGASILYDYGQPGVRALVWNQLAAMRAAGLESLRVFFVYDHDLSENPYFVPAATGRLVEPFRSNLINYLSDIRRAGFLRVTLAFEPRPSVDPAERFGPYNPATFDESWSLIRDTRPLLKQYGPTDTRVDLSNEGAPSDYLTQQVSNYVTRMYSNYVNAFGSDDVTVSAGFWPGMQHLIDALRASGKPLPRWFDIHPRWHYDTALADLRATDAQLSANGLAQPLVIGEEKYNDPEVARAIADFQRTSSRSVEEVMEWPLEIGGGDPGNAQQRCIDPPYRIDAYASGLKGAAPPTRLTAVLSDHALSLRTPYGQNVTALEAGAYTVTVSDRSRLRGFYLDRKRTSIRRPARALWHVTLRVGTHRFGATGRRPRALPLAVLAAG